ncbi:fasciclin-3-like isoform X2 [Pollicipes pollicipes]|uniref:fasciclin-3-like isoform X2 n=1 Tax=Pollicipes pollicipes TaxID=41117 RepID=UPI001885033F|nr:fasciclin-3-like isoform X2 [Pollicipes pollicipes]
MKFEYIFLPFLIQGVCGQLFSVQPRAENVARLGDSVTLECITREEVNCAWKLEDAPGLSATGFINVNVPAELGIKARDPTSRTDCTIIIESVTSDHNGKYLCSPFTAAGGQEDAEFAEVIIAQKPVAVEFSGEHAGHSELLASADEPASITCEARDARPKAELLWYLDDVELFEGVTVEDEVDPGSKLVTSRSTLTYQFSREDDGAGLRCAARHPGYDEQDNQEVSINIMVQYAPYRPEGDLGTLYGFTQDQEGTVTVTSPPTPAPPSWPGRWKAAARSPPASRLRTRRFSSGVLEEVNPAEHQYALTLTIMPVVQSDQDVPFQLRLANAIGESTLDFRMGTGAPPPPPPQPAAEGNGPTADADGAGRPNSDAHNGSLDGGAIAGIIVALVLLLLIIGVVVFGRSRGKWCFAAKPSDAGAEADTESAHDEKTDKPEKKPFKLSNLYSSLVTKKREADVEMADNKDETKELTATEGEQASPKKEAEVVYAELVLNKDGVKTEVRPSPEKTEYAVIVGTKKEEGKE